MDLQKNTIRKIKTEFDYEAYAEEHLHIREGNLREDEIRVCCPVCDDNRYRLYLNNNKKFFNCFNCNFSNRNYDVFDLVSHTERISRFQAICKLVREFSEVTPEDIHNYLSFREDKIVKEEEVLEAITPIEKMPEGLLRLEEETSFNKPYWDYLYGRGLTKEEILDMGTYYSPKRLHFIYRKGKKIGNLSKRVVWPVYGGSGDLVSWLARTIEPNSTKQKYINCPLSDMAKTLWPYSPPPPSKKEAIIVEGVLDCVAVRRAGFYAYASFGKSLSRHQIKLLKDWGVESLVIFYDPEAKKAINRAVESVKMQFETYVVDQSDWIEYNDPGDLLARSDGCDILNKTLSKRINAYSLDYTKWALE